MLRITLLQLCILVAGSVSPMAVGPAAAIVGVDNVMLGVIAVSLVNFAYVFVFLRSSGDDDSQKRALTGAESDKSFAENEDVVGPRPTGSTDRYLDREQGCSPKKEVGDA